MKEKTANKTESYPESMTKEMIEEEDRRARRSGRREETTKLFRLGNKILSKNAKFWCI